MKVIIYAKERLCDMEKIENLINVSKLNKLLKKEEAFNKQEEKKKKVCTILAIAGAVVGIVLLAYGLYKYLKPDYLDEFDDDDFDDDFFDDEDDEA